MMRNFVIILDGVGYDQIQTLQPPVLTALARRLGIVPVQSLLSFSSGIYCTFWSGKHLEEHGVWTEFFLRPGSGFQITSILRPIPGKFLPRALAYFLLMGISRIGWKGTEHFAIPPRLQRYFGRTGSNYHRMPPVPLETSQDFSLRLAEKNSTWKYVYGDPLNEQSGSEVLRSADDTETLIVCLPELDHAGHVWGPESDTYRRAFLDFDRRLGSLLRSLDSTGCAFRLFVFSDHGMNRIIRSFDFWSYLEQSGFRLGEDYLAFINSTIVPLWFTSGHRDEIVDRLNRSGAGHVLTAPEKAFHHLRFPGRKFGDEFFLADEGVECVPNFINLARRKGSGMHGYDPRLPSTRAFFIGADSLTAAPEDMIGIHRALEEIMIPGILPGVRSGGEQTDDQAQR